MNKLLIGILTIFFIMGAGCTAAQQSDGPNGPPPEGFTNKHPVTNNTARQADSEPVTEQTSTATTLTSDFIPETQAAPSPSSDPMAEGPWNGRFMTATSTDGLHWEKTGSILGAQLNVPDLVYDPDGTLYLYFSGYTLGNVVNKTAVAISYDQGKTWIWKYLTFNGFTMDPADLSVLYIEEEDVFRLYGSYRDGDVLTTHWADSNDGLIFTYGGKSFDVSENAMVPSVIQMNDTYHLYAGDHANRLTWHGTSTDGKNFTEQDKIDLRIIDPQFPAQGQNYFAGNIVPVNNGYRMYAYSRAGKEGGTIGALFSTDGYTWASEGIVLEVTLPDLEADFVKDPAVIKQPDGSWFMVYPTNIPK